jgi:hypothetical protein
VPVPAGGDEEVVELPAWSPTVEDVADYVPHRTLARVPVGITGSADQYRLTFDETTRPTAQIVRRLVATQVALIGARVRPLHASSQLAASGLAALAAAVWVERSWPNDAESLQRANDMERQLNLMLTGLIAANDLANSGDSNPETIDVVYPVWSFPESDPRFDSASYF